MARKHGARARRQQNRRNRDRQQSKPQGCTEPDRKPDVDSFEEARDRAVSWLRKTG